MKIGKQEYRIYLIDLDGTLCENIYNEEGIGRMAAAKPFPQSIKVTNKLHDKGNYICIFTARTDEHKEVTEKWLRKNGVRYDQIILNKPRRIGKYVGYHLIDDAHVRATTYKGNFTDFVKKNVEIEVFEDK